jgi:hypothetical protein
MVRAGQVDTEPSAEYYYLDMREENICEGPGLAGRHGQQLLEVKDGAGRTSGHGAQYQYYYLDMREENICEGPGLAGRHGQQLLEGKDGAGRTGGHGAQCGGQDSAAGRAAPQRGAVAHSA